jgi:hypothetical protein
LCLENYWQQWHCEWTVARNGPPNKIPPPGVINPMYIGKLRGIKHSWTTRESRHKTIHVRYILPLRRRTRM